MENGDFDPKDVAFKTHLELLLISHSIVIAENEPVDDWSSDTEAPMPEDQQNPSEDVEVWDDELDPSLTPFIQKIDAVLDQPEFHRMRGDAIEKADSSTWPGLYEDTQSHHNKPCRLSGMIKKDKDQSAFLRAIKPTKHKSESNHIIHPFLRNSGN